MRRFLLNMVVVAGLLLGPAACTNVRPTIKIGVLGSFEGLHRRSGYAALEAARSAIAEFPDVAAGILPLALDDAGNPAQAQRAAEKLLADPEVKAVVGPLTPALFAATQPVRQGANLVWLAPFAPPAANPVDDPAAWALPLVQEAARLAKLAGARRLVLAGWTPGWPELSQAQWSQAIAMPAILDDAPGTVQADDAVFWLGSPEAGATYLNALRKAQPNVTFWLGPLGSDPVFAERATGLERVYWLSWNDPGYNQWASTHPSPSPSNYLIYRATRAALQAATGAAHIESDAHWFVQAFVADADGKSVPFVP